MANNPLTNMWQSIVGTGTQQAMIQSTSLPSTSFTVAGGLAHSQYSNALYQNLYQQSMASTASYVTTQGWTSPTLDAESAANLITQCDEDHSLLDNKGRLKFGRYRGRRLCKADLDYVVALGRAIGKLRQAINKDIRARRALARLTQ